MSFSYASGMVCWLVSLVQTEISLNGLTPCFIQTFISGRYIQMTLVILFLQHHHEDDIFVFYLHISTNIRWIIVEFGI